MVIPPSQAQIQGAGQITGGLFDPVDVERTGNLMRSSFESEMQLIGSDIGAQLGGNRYGSSLGHQIGESTRRGLTGLESEIGQMRIGAEEQAMQRRMGALQNLPAYMAAVDPQQAFEQARESAEQRDFERRFPGYAALYFGALPGPESEGKTSAWNILSPPQQKEAKPSGGQQPPEGTQQSPDQNPEAGRTSPNIWR